MLVEDSGLFIEALGGFPGVYSAYVLRTLGPSRLLRLLGVRERRAHFVTVFGYAPSRGRVQLFRGEVHGRLADRPRGRHGFGFDPIFVPDGLDRTFAEMELAEKDRRSHRGRALEALAALLA